MDEDIPESSVSNTDAHDVVQDNTSLSNYYTSSRGSEADDSWSEGEADSIFSDIETECSGLLQECKEAAREWGVQRFKKNPYSDKEKPFVQVQGYDDLHLTADEEKGILSERVIAACSSHLQMIPDLKSFALVKCCLSHKRLINISTLRFYHYFQYVDLSNNMIDDLSPLGELPFLTYLDASHNKLEEVLNFKAPFNLTKVNLSHNAISRIPDLTEFWSLTDLNLSHNNISVIEGLENLRYLSSLNLTHNLIHKLGNLNNLRIQYLYLQFNQIDKTTQNFSLKSLCHLRLIDLSHNHLDTLWFFEDADNLENIQMASNKISNLMNIYYLRKLRYLTTLNLSNNPVCSSSYFNATVITVLHHVTTLNEKTVDTKGLLRRIDNNDYVLNLAGEQRIRLLLLEQVNQPSIGNNVFPCDQPPPLVMVLVGPSGSRKREVLKKFVAAFPRKNVVMGVSHTTRQRNQDEVEGEDYYFIDKQTFSTMLAEGQFLACSEFLGEYFGFASSELSKAYDGVLLLHADLHGALTMKVRSVNPKLILALPFSDDHHIRSMLYKYCKVAEENGALYIRNCPEEALKAVEKFEESLRQKVEIQIRQMVYDLVDAICAKTPDPSDSGILIMERTNHSKESMQSTENEENRIKQGASTSSESCNFIMDDNFEISEADILFYESTQNNFKGKFNKSSTNRVSASAINYLSSEEFDEDYVESINTFFGDQMKTFFTSVLQCRADLIELHWANPGLFKDIVPIFTENEQEAIKKLKDIVKYVTKYNKVAKPFIEDFKSDILKKPSVASKIGSFFDDIKREISVTDMQFNEEIQSFSLPRRESSCKGYDKCRACSYAEQQKGLY